MDDKKTLGQVAYEAYGDLAGAHGPWKTFDGREMPRWEALQGEAGDLTKRRWETGVQAAMDERAGTLEAVALAALPFADVGIKPTEEQREALDAALTAAARG